ncbi:MAG: efflux RND transporter periplasmic adaptor subunit [Synergistaceae bacterium]|jgi:RND family efflux transporter MFP subunit|nr:efflux RND transporter periplasmic adaptor subunit [Synergistaceae bacterium]
MKTLKTFFMAAMALIIVLSGTFVGYGIYLNRVSNSHIETMMASRAVSVRGISVSQRAVRPEIVLDSINLQAELAADVIAQIDGTVSEFSIAQGGEVKRGQKLCTLVNLDIALQISRADTDVAKAQTSYAQARSEADRNKRLADKDSISKSELETSIARVEAAEAELSAAKIARSQLDQQSGFQTVTSTIDGFVTVIYHQVGSYVQKGQPIAMIADFSKLFTKGQIEDKEIKNISPLDGVFLMPMNASSLSEKALDTSFRTGFEEKFVIKARIRDISPPISESAPLRIVNWAIDNDRDLLRPGRYMEVTIGREDSKKTLAVPIDLIYDLRAPSLYVKDSDSRLAEVDVKTGVYGGGLIEILDGIEEGDVVITSGVEGLEPGTKIDVTLEDY